MRNRELHFDKRVIHRNLRSGAVSEEEYRNYLKNLKDLTNQAATFEAALRLSSFAEKSHMLENEDGTG